MPNGIEKTSREKKEASSRIPKYSKFSCVQETRSKISQETKETQRWKTAAEKITTYVSKGTQTTNSDLENSLRPMSLEKISKDLMKQFKAENLESNTHVPEEGKTAEQIKLLKEICPIAAKSQKPGGITKKTSTSDLKTSSAFGGMRLVSKKNAHLKRNLFHSMKSESKDDNPEVYFAESNSKELKTTPGSEKDVQRKEAERSKDENAEQLETGDLKSLISPLTLKELNFNATVAFGGMRLTPRKKSTHQKPDLFENIQKESREITTNEKKMTPDSENAVKKQTKLLNKENSEHLLPEEAELLKTSPAAQEAGPKTSTPFEGAFFRFKKGSKLKPDIFKSLQKESKNYYQKEHPTESLTKELKKISPNVPKTVIKPEKSEQLPTRPEPSKNQITKNIKEADPAPVTAFGGMRFRPRQKNVRDVFSYQKSKN